MISGLQVYRPGAGWLAPLEEKVILAKIKKAAFHHYVRPGDTIILHAEIESIAAEAASTNGKILCGEKTINRLCGE